MGCAGRRARRRFLAQRADRQRGRAAVGAAARDMAQSEAVGVRHGVEMGSGDLAVEEGGSGEVLLPLW